MTIDAAAVAQAPAASRERLLAAAVERFCAIGYAAVSVEDIAASAGVSRMTFYRQFSGKAAIATELFARESVGTLPLLTAIAERRYTDETVVRGWISEVLAADQANRRLLRVFLQASVDEPAFAATGHRMIETIIAELGKAIPAFAADRDHPLQRRRWLEAWLLLYELLDQSNHAALHSGVATDPLVVDILAARFARFAGS